MNLRFRNTRFFFSLLWQDCAVNIGIGQIPMPSAQQLLDYQFMLRHLLEDKIIAVGELSKATRFHYPDSGLISETNPLKLVDGNPGLITRWQKTAGSVEVESFVRIVLDPFDSTAFLPPGFPVRLVFQRNSANRLLLMRKGDENGDDEISASQVNIEILKIEMVVRKIRLTQPALSVVNKRLANSTYRSYFLRRFMQKFLITTREVDISLGVQHRHAPTRVTFCFLASHEAGLGSLSHPSYHFTAMNLAEVQIQLPNAVNYITLSPDFSNGSYAPTLFFTQFLEQNLGKGLSDLAKYELHSKPDVLLKTQMVYTFDISRAHDCPVGFLESENDCDGVSHARLPRPLSGPVKLRLRFASPPPAPGIWMVTQESHVFSALFEMKPNPSSGKGEPIVTVGAVNFDDSSNSIFFESGGF